MFFKFLLSIRFSIIKLLAGQSSVMLNTKISNEGCFVKGHAVLSNLDIEKLDTGLYIYGNAGSVGIVKDVNINYCKTAVFMASEHKWEGKGSEVVSQVTMKDSTVNK